jgi:peroxiredoxin family protein
MPVTLAETVVKPGGGRAVALPAELQEAVSEAVRLEVERVLARRSRKLALLVTSGEVDKLMVAAILAAGAGAMDYEVEMFFAFWGLSAIRARSVFEGKQPVDKLLTLMLGSGCQGLPASRFNFLGVGARFLENVMRAKKVVSLEELLTMAEETGVRMTACQMSMNVMGITREELRPGVSLGGVTSFLASATQCGAALTI